MGWTYLVESEDSQSLYQIGSDQSPTVKSSDTLPQYYFQECQRANYQPHQYGMMSQPLEEKTCQKSTSSTEDSHARTSVLQEMEKAWQESEADYFSRLLDLRKKSNLNLYFSKTYQPSHQGEELKSLIKLPKWGMIVGGLVYPLRKLERIIEERDGGYWATPNTMDSLPSRSYEAMLRQATNGGRKNRSRPGNLREQIDPLMCQAYKEAKAIANGMPFKRELLPTPDASARGPTKTYDPKCKSQSGRTLQSYAAMFPTPQASDHRNRGNLNNPSVQRRIKLGKQIGLTVVAGGQLNPNWVEWLMGYPLEWTGLRDWATQLCQSKRGKRLKN